MDLITRLRNGGDTSDLYEEDDEAPPIVPEAQPVSVIPPLVPIPEGKSPSPIFKQAAAPSPEVAAESIQEMPTVVLPPAAPPQPSVPDVLMRILGSPVESELLAVARQLDPEADNRKPLTLVFHTPVGQVKCPVCWCSCGVNNLSGNQDLILITMRSAGAMFIPNPGAEVEISFAEATNNAPLNVVCLSKPLPMYGGAGIDLLCFLPQNEPVEKTGQLKEGAPSVVSGAASDEVDKAGEPIAEGEKSASVEVPVTEDIDFDKARES